MLTYQTYPELYPKEGPVQYIPTIYGFKIFGQKGSKFELMYDNMGQAKNQKEVDGILNKKKPTGVPSQSLLSEGAGGMMQSSGKQGGSAHMK